MLLKSKNNNLPPQLFNGFIKNHFYKTRTHNLVVFKKPYLPVYLTTKLNFNTNILKDESDLSNEY